MGYPDGTFRSERLRSATDERDWAAYLVWQQDRPIGLALVRGLDQPVRVLNAFFIVRGQRRAGIGSRAVREVIRKHPVPGRSRTRQTTRLRSVSGAASPRRRSASVGLKKNAAFLAVLVSSPDVWISFSTAGTAP